MADSDMYGNTGESPEIELVPGSLRAFRAWGIHSNDQHSRLQACARNYTWKPGEQVATCINPVGSKFIQRRQVNVPFPPGGSGGWLSVTALGSGAQAMVPYTSFSIEEELPVVIPHRSPDPECTCGFYAQYSNRAIEYGNHGPIGAIQVSGRVVLGTVGLRAEKATVEGLYLSDRLFPRDQIPALQERLAHIYKVPVFLNLEEFQERFPEHDVSELAPKPKPPKIIGVEVWAMGSNRANIRVTYSDHSVSTYPYARDLRYGFTGDTPFLEFTEADGPGTRHCLEPSKEVRIQFTN